MSECFRKGVRNDTPLKSLIKRSVREAMTALSIKSKLAAGFCCCLLLFSAVCSYLLQFVSQHESKMTQKASQPLQNGPRNSPGGPKMPSWGLKKTALERQNSSPRRPWMPSDTPLDSKSEKSIPFWSLFVHCGYPK